jgi:YfiH family protein
MPERPYGNGGFRIEPLPNGWQVGRFASLEAVGIRHLVTTRQGPDGRQVRYDTAAAGRQIATVLDCSGAAYLDQVHAGDVLICEAPGRAGSADGLVTNSPGIALVGKSADCPIVLIADKQGSAVGFAHGSWRATVAGIVANVVARMIELGCDPPDLLGCIGPSAGPECYEVGAEVRSAAISGLGEYAEGFFRPGPHGRDHFDLWAANAGALLRAGLPAESIHVAGVCTMCRNDLFPSYRCEGDAAGRFAAAIAAH